MEPLTSESVLIGVDLGGTHVRAGRIANAKIETLHRQALPKADSLQPVLDAIVQSIEAVWHPAVAAIGVGVPGLVDQSTGEVFDIQNIAHWHRVALGPWLQQRFGCPVVLDNDANCLALSELRYGCAKGYRHVVALALGTGMGAGIVSNGKLHSGLNSGAGELGAIPYLDKDYEAYCSGAFFEAWGPNAGERFFQDAKLGNEQALQLFAQFGQHLARAILLATYAFAPELIVLGGSAAQSHPFFAESLSATLLNERKLGVVPPIHYSEQPHSAVLGAAALCFDKLT